MKKLLFFALFLFGTVQINDLFGAEEQEQEREGATPERTAPVIPVLTVPTQGSSPAPITPPTVRREERREEGSDISSPTRTPVIPKSTLLTVPALSTPTATGVTAEEGKEERITPPRSEERKEEALEYFPTPPRTTAIPGVTESTYRSAPVPLIDTPPVRRQGRLDISSPKRTELTPSPESDDGRIPLHGPELNIFMGGKDISDEAFKRMSNSSVGLRIRRRDDESGLESPVYERNVRRKIEKVVSESPELKALKNEFEKTLKLNLEEKSVNLAAISDVIERARKLNLTRQLLNSSYDESTLWQIIFGNVDWQSVPRDGLLKFVQFLIDAGAEVNPKDQSFSALRLAAYRNHPELIELLLKNGAGDIQTNKDNALLMSIKMNNHRAIPQMLIAAGADVNAQDDRGNTTLMLAVEKNRPDIIELLLNNKVDQENKDKALLFAIKLNKRIEIKKTITGKKDSATIEAIKFNKIIEMLLKSGANINAQDRRGNTPLIYAANNNNPESLKLLLDNGADISIKNKEGKTVRYFVSDKPELEKLLNLHYQKKAAKQIDESGSLPVKELAALIAEYLVFEDDDESKEEVEKKERSSDPNRSPSLHEGPGSEILPDPAGFREVTRGPGIGLKALFERDDEDQGEGSGIALRDLLNNEEEGEEPRRGPGPGVLPTPASRSVNQGPGIGLKGLFERDDEEGEEMQLGDDEETPTPLDLGEEEGEPDPELENGSGAKK